MTNQYMQDGYQVTVYPNGTIEKILLSEEIPEPAPLPILKIINIASSAQGSSISGDFSDITCPIGSTLTILARIVHPVTEAVIPVTATFRMPVRARDGREFIILASVAQGEATVTIPFDESGAWFSNAEIINSGLPAEEHMAFSGIRVFVYKV